MWNRTDEAVYAGGNAVVGPNPVAAMPSLHMAGAVLVALLVWRAAPRFRALAVAYPLAMALTLVYTGEHYVADVVVGAALAVAAWASHRRWLAGPLRSGVRLHGPASRPSSDL